MSVFFTDHARKRIEERGISERQVREALTHPDRIQADEIVRVRILQKRFQRRILEVVAEQIGNHTRVITVYWL